MKNSIIIIILSLAFNGTFAQSVDVKPESTNQKLEREFSSNMVAPMQLAAFEDRGEQKLNNLANYLENISDQNLDTIFRQQAHKLALQLFVDEAVPFKYYHEGKIVESTIESYLSFLLKANNETTNFQFLNISKLSEVTQNSDGSYSWLLQYVEEQSQADESTSNHIITIKVALKKIEKKFGNQSKWIWEVLLDEMQSLIPAP